MTRRDTAIAAVGEVRPNLSGADRYAIATAVLAAVDIYDMHAEIGRQHRARNEYHRVRATPPPGHVIEP